jgi:hypothetical protein
VTFEINRNLSNGHCRRLRVRPRSAKDRTEAGFEVLCRVRLHYVVVGAGVEQPDNLGFVVSSRCDNHRHIDHRTDHAECLCTVEVWEAEVEYHHVESSGNCSLNTRHGGSDGIDLVTSLREPACQRLPDTLIVFDDQDGCHSVTIPNSSGVNGTSGGISPAVNQPLSEERPTSSIMVGCGA